MKNVWKSVLEFPRVNGDGAVSTKEFIKEER